MKIAIIVFMVLAGLICLFSVVSIIADFVKGKKQPQLVSQEKIEEIIKLELKKALEEMNNLKDSSELKEVNKDAIVINKVETKDLATKYSELTNKNKGFYDKIVEYASKIEGTKQFKNKTREEYKIGNSKIVRLEIKRDTIVATLFFTNSGLQEISNGTIKLKQSSSSIKVVDTESTNFVIKSIDVCYKQILEEKERKKLARKKGN